MASANVAPRSGLTSEAQTRSELELGGDDAPGQRGGHVAGAEETDLMRVGLAHDEILLLENGGADADERGPFLDGDLEILRHAHGKLAHDDARKFHGVDVARELTESGEYGTGQLGVGDDGGHGHETDELDVREQADLADDVGSLGGGESGLGLFAGDVDFEKYLRDEIVLQRATADLAGKLETVHGVNETDKG